MNRRSAVDVTALMESGAAQGAALELVREPAVGAMVRVDPRALSTRDNVRRGDVAAAVARDTDFVDNVRAHGVLEPVLITPDYRLLAGFRRREAAILADLPEIPAVVHAGADEADIIEKQLSENLQRAPLPALDQAHAFEHLRRLGRTQLQIGARVGLSQTTVSQRIALLRLPDEAQDAVERGELTADAGYELAKVSAEPERVARALAEIRRGTPALKAIEAQVKAMRAAEAYARSREQLDAQGVRVVEAPRDDVWYSRTERPLGEGFMQLRIAPAKHAALPCHAASISKRTGDVVYVCVDPTQHPELLGPEDRVGLDSALSRGERDHALEAGYVAAATDPAWQADVKELHPEWTPPPTPAPTPRSERDVALDQARRRRYAWYASRAAAGQLPGTQADRVGTIAWALLERTSPAIARQACTLLGIAALDPVAGLAEWVGDSQHGLELAAWLCAKVHEEVVETPASIARIVDDAAAHGYELSDAERQWAKDAAR